ncbi:MAG: ATP-binding protein [Phycisphaerales bacterium]
MEPTPRRTSLRTALAATTLGPLLGTVAILALVSAIGGRAIVADHAETIVARSLGRVQDRIQILIEHVVSQDELVQFALGKTRLDPGALEFALGECAESFSQHRDLSYLGFGLDADGSYYLLERLPGDRIRASALNCADGDEAHRIDRVLENGTFGRSTRERWDGYDPRTRPFYVEAKAACAPVWTESYTFWQGGGQSSDDGVTYATPLIREERFLGVVGVDFQLTALKRCLDDIQRDAPGMIFLIEDRRDGSERVLAQAEFRLNPEADDHATALTEAMASFLASGSKEHFVATRRFASGGEQFFGAIAPLGVTEGPRWRVGVVLPESSIASPLISTLRWMAIIGVAAAALGSLAAFRLSARITRPFEELRRRLRGEPPSERGSAGFDIEEVAEFAQAYDEMQARVTTRQGDLEQTNRAMADEIAQRRAAEDALRAHEARLAELNRALIELAHSRTILAGDLGQALREATELGAHALSVARVSVWRFDADRRTLVCDDLYERDAGQHSRGTSIAAEAHPAYFAALEQERVVSASDASSDPRTAGFALGYLNRFGITSMLDASLRRGERVIGAVCFEHVGPRRVWTREDELFADAFADLVMLALEASERARAEADLRNLNATLERRVDERTRDLARANQRLSELDRLKSQFLATTSHELRTPLHSILGFTSIVKSGLVGPVNDEQRKQLEIVHASAKHLLSLITDLLDLSRIEAGRMEVFPESVTPASVIDEVARSITPLVAAKGLAWRADVRDPGLRIECDRKRLFQILLNLASNAVKFTERGEVRIEAGPRDDRYEISVIDTGVGIPQDQMSHIFEAFGQISVSDRRLAEAESGTGLGLYLSKQLVGLLGGTIRAESELGHGSRFTLSLPLTLAPAQGSPERPATSA